MKNTKEKQISVRISAEAEAWLERQSRKSKSKGDVVRELIDLEMERTRQKELVSMFNEAARNLTESDRAEREDLLTAFADHD
jgi:Arc/MetJ-type ribon-helix-helix transcriptional regulator